MFTGTYPDTSGNFSAFAYGPETSPFAWTRWLRPLAPFYRPRRILAPARWALAWASRRLTGAFHADPAWIPLPFLPYFSVVEDQRPIFAEGALPATSIFDLCRAHARQFLYAAHPVSGDDDRTERLLLETVRSGRRPALHVAQFSALDEKGHPHGPLLPDGPFEGQAARDAEAMEEQLREVDARIARVVDAFDRAYDQVDLVVVGDHGMAPVRRRVDALRALRATGLRPGRDYVAFVDSTFLKVWAPAAPARQALAAALAGTDWGDLLGEEDRRRLRIGVDERYGHLMVAARPGVLFWPDYFHVTDRTIRGMHGYVDKREETYGLLLMRDGVGGDALGRRSLVDVFPTLCRLLDLPVPAANEGRALEAPRASTR